MKVKAPFRLKMRESYSYYRSGIRSHGGACRASRFRTLILIPESGPYLTEIELSTWQKMFRGWKRVK